MNNSQHKLIDFTNLTTNKLEEIFHRQKNLVLELNNKIVNLDKNNLTFYDCFDKSHEEESKYTLEFVLADFEQLHPDREIREKSAELNKLLSIFMLEQSMREDVYDVILHYYNNFFLNKNTSENLSQEQKKYVEKTMIGYNMLGLNLDNDKKEKSKKITQQLIRHSSDYTMNLSNVNTELFFEKEQLRGMNENWLNNRFIQETNKYKVKLQYPDYVPIMEYCSVRETRKIMAEMMGSRCIENNLPIILDTINLRKQKAELFGFNCYSDYKLQNLMAKNSATVLNFLNNLLENLKPIVEEDKQHLLNVAKELDNLDILESYDITYYSRMCVERESGLNMDDLKIMFSVESVTKGIFEIYQKLLGFKFVDITEDNPQALYFSDIKLFCVYDENNINIPLGYFYLDLFPRDGKYNHAAMFTLIRKSKYDLPISAIVCNFDPKLDLDFDNVVTYFHEFGHLMHNMSSTNEISSLAGTACQRDFVETPSQMFEEWCYRLEPLKKLVKAEYVDGVDQILVDKINKQNKQLQGISNARQIIYSLIDSTVHSENIPEDIWSYYNDLTQQLFGWCVSPKVNIIANWGHLYGYDASYYGYLWSKVFAIDLFSFFLGNELNEELGYRLRSEILSKGGAIDGEVLLRNFMNREPNLNAFIDWLKK